jgi:pilus assembly protein Flp/PilA
MAAHPIGPTMVSPTQRRKNTMKLYITTVNALARVADKERGATMPEYGLMVALIAVVAIGAVTAIGTSVTGVFNQVAGAIGAAN